MRPGRRGAAIRGDGDLPPPVIPIGARPSSCTTRLSRPPATRWRGWAVSRLNGRRRSRRERRRHQSPQIDSGRQDAFVRRPTIIVDVTSARASSQLVPATWLERAPFLCAAAPYRRSPESHTAPQITFFERRLPRNTGLRLFTGTGPEFQCTCAPSASGVSIEFPRAFKRCSGRFGHACRHGGRRQVRHPDLIGKSCREEARRWRRWRGGRKYRASAGAGPVVASKHSGIVNVNATLRPLRHLRIEPTCLCCNKPAGHQRRTVPSQRGQRAGILCGEAEGRPCARPESDAVRQYPDTPQQPSEFIEFPEVVSVVSCVGRGSKTG
jgi:hypothetical protein